MSACNWQRAAAPEKMNVSLVLGAVSLFGSFGSVWFCLSPVVIGCDAHFLAGEVEPALVFFSFGWQAGVLVGAMLSHACSWEPLVILANPVS